MVYLIVSHLAINHCRWSTKLLLSQKRQTVDVSFKIELYEHPHLIDVLGYHTSLQIKEMYSNPDSVETKQKCTDMAQRPLVLIVPITWHVAKDNGGFKWESRPLNPLDPSQELDYILTDSLSEVSPLISPNYKLFVLGELENHDTQDIGFLLLDVTFLRSIPTDSPPDASSLRNFEPDKCKYTTTLELSYSQNIDERYRLFLPLKIMDNMPGQNKIETDIDIDIGDIPLRLSYGGVQWNSTVMYVMDANLKESLDRAYKDWTVDDTAKNHDYSQLLATGSASRSCTTKKYKIGGTKEDSYNLWIDVKDETILLSSDDEDEPTDQFDIAQDYVKEDVELHTKVFT